MNHMLFVVAMIIYNFFHIIYTPGILYPGIPTSSPAALLWTKSWVHHWANPSACMSDRQSRPCRKDSVFQPLIRSPRHPGRPRDLFDATDLGGPFSKGTFGVHLAGYPSSCSQNIIPYCPIQPLGTLPTLPNFSMCPTHFLVRAQPQPTVRRRSGKLVGIQRFPWQFSRWAYRYKWSYNSIL